MNPRSGGRRISYQVVNTSISCPPYSLVDQNPSVRALAKPILNLFAGEPRNKKWKQKMDELLKDNPATFAELMEK